MRSRFVTLATVTLIAAGFLLAANAGTSQGPAYRAPRTADGKPNLNGIWQALNTASWDVEPHAAAVSINSWARSRSSTRVPRIRRMCCRWPVTRLPTPDKHPTGCRRR